MNVLVFILALLFFFVVFGKEDNKKLQKIREEGASEVADTLIYQYQAICKIDSTKMEVVDAENFEPKRKLAFYNSIQRRLEKRSFQYLADFVDGTCISPEKPAPTFHRLLVSEDKKIVAIISDFSLNGLLGILQAIMGKVPAKVVSFYSYLENGKTVVSQRKIKLMFEPSPNAIGNRLTPKIDIDRYVDSHNKKVDEVLQTEKCSFTPIDTFEEYMFQATKSGNIYAEYRQQKGDFITEKEFSSLGELVGNRKDILSKIDAYRKSIDNKISNLEA